MPILCSLPWQAGKAGVVPSTLFETGSVDNSEGVKGLRMLCIARVAQHEVRRSFFSGRGEIECRSDQVMRRLQWALFFSKPPVGVFVAENWEGGVVQPASLFTDSILDLGRSTPLVFRLGSARFSGALCTCLL